MARAACLNKRPARIAKGLRRHRELPVCGFGDLLLECLVALLPHLISRGQGMNSSRRGLVIAFAASVVVRWLWPNPGLAEGSDQTVTQIRWRVPVAHLDTVRSNLHFEGTVTNHTDEKGVPLTFVFVGLVLLPYLAEAVLALRREIVYGGVVIDTRGAEIAIDHDKRLDSGVIVVVTRRGADFYERDDIHDPTELIAALLKGK